MGKTIEVIVSPDGEVKIEAHGYTGEACEHDTRELERALGSVSNRRHKPERNRQATAEKARA